MRDLLSQVMVGRRNDAHVNTLRDGTAERIDLALFDQAQQFSLMRQRQLADLVEEECAARGQAGRAEVVFDCAGEAPSVMAE